MSVIDMISISNPTDTFSSELTTDKLTFMMNASEKGSITTTSSGIDLAGGSTITANAFSATSDVRLKTDIRRISSKPLELIKKLRGVRFEWSNLDHREKYGPQIGLIAQEVEQVIPEIVRTDPETEKKSVDYAKLVAVLIEAMRYMIGEEINE